MTFSEGLTIGTVAARAGVSVAALRFYEQRGLISASRTSGNQRRYPRSVLRRLAVIAAAQRVGLTLTQIHNTQAAPTDSAELDEVLRSELTSDLQVTRS